MLSGARHGYTQIQSHYMASDILSLAVYTLYIYGFQQAFEKGFKGKHNKWFAT